MKRTIVRHAFVEYIPDDPEEGVVYVSVSFATAVHRCCCGCGREVVTPLSPTDWTLMYDGATISLDPSIGNWSFPCQSHYWLRRNKVEWAPRWSQARVAAGRARDQAEKAAYFDGVGDTASEATAAQAEPGQIREQPSLWTRVKDWLS